MSSAAQDEPANHGGSGPQPELRVVVRPLGSPLPLGFLGLMVAAVATVASAMLQLAGPSVSP